MIPFAPYLLAGSAGLALISSGAALYFHKDAQLQKERANILQESNDALRVDLKAHAASATAFTNAINSLNQSAAISARALNDARKTDATLDRCLAYDPGIDLTGGLFRSHQN